MSQDNYRKKGNYECYIFGNESVELTFSFDIDVLQQQIKDESSSTTSPTSTPESEFGVIADKSETHASQTQIFENLYAQASLKDVILVASDGTEVYAHRCILAAVSDVFAAIFESKKSEIPVRIEVEFDTKCIEALYDTVTPENVCDIAILAFENNSESLTQKCLQILSKEKSKIDKEKLQSLPPTILVACLTLS
uniref:BTB domain-containing protein n=1 Tax=Panagrolaimus sp. ES5 TaxID=591445 RepID=A0AC34FR22_9BILA